MPIHRPSLIIGQLIKQLRSDWETIGENENWRLEQSKSKAGSFRIITQNRPLQQVAKDTSLQEAMASFELLLELFLDVRITPISIFKTIDLYLKRDSLVVNAADAAPGLKELQDAIEKEDAKESLLDQVPLPSDAASRQEGDDGDDQLIPDQLKDKEESYGESLLNWITSSNNPIAKKILLPLVDPFLPKPELTLRDEIKRGEKKKTILFSGIATIYCLIIRYSSLDFFLLSMAATYFLVYYLVTEWKSVVERFREMQRKVAKKLVREKIKHRLGKLTTSNSCKKTE